MGSLPEWQKFFRSMAKLQDRFWDQAQASVSTETGWLADGLLSGSSGLDQPSP